MARNSTPPVISRLPRLWRDTPVNVARFKSACKLQRHRVAAALADMALGRGAHVDRPIGAAMRPELVIDFEARSACPERYARPFFFDTVHTTSSAACAATGDERIKPAAHQRFPRIRPILGPLLSSCLSAGTT